MPGLGPSVRPRRSDGGRTVEGGRRGGPSEGEGAVVVKGGRRGRSAAGLYGNSSVMMMSPTGASVVISLAVF